MHYDRSGYEPLDYMETKRRQLQAVLEESRFDFQDEKVQEASRQMDRIILFYYKNC